MRKLVAASAATLALGLIGASGASADPGFSQFCMGVNDFGYSQGACVSNFASEGQSGAVWESLCSVNSNFASANHGECVSFFEPSPTP